MEGGGGKEGQKAGKKVNFPGVGTWCEELLEPAHMSIFGGLKYREAGISVLSSTVPVHWVPSSFVSLESGWVYL